MMLRSVAQVLEHFDYVPPSEDIPDEPEDIDVPVKPIGYLDPEEVARKVEDARAKTRAECEARADAFLSAALEDQRRKFEEQLAAARREWTEVQAERLIAQVASTCEVLEARIAAAAARALRPFVLEKVREQAVRDMRASIAKLLVNTENPVIEVSGPQDLLDALAQSMADTAVSLSMRPDASCELRAVAGDTMLETQMQEWASRLAEPAGPNT